MDVTQALLGEHGIVHLLVEQLDEALPRYQTTAELRAASEPLAITLLGHARIEDETLFQPYEKHTGSLGPLRPVGIAVPRRTAAPQYSHSLVRATLP